MKSIKINNIRFSYEKGKDIFYNLNLELFNQGQEGRVIALLGPSGCGKTTFLKLISRSLEPDYGNIILTPSSPCFSYLPQNPVLFHHLTPFENVKYFERVKEYRDRIDLNYIETLIYELGVHDAIHKRKRVDELSGGQKQRIGLIRALSIKPDILLLDEPTKGLNGVNKIDFIEQLQSLVRESNVLVLYVTHQMKEAEKLANEVLYFTKGEGNVTQVLKNRAIDFFLKPPDINAYREVYFPDGNLLKCNITSGSLNLTKIEEREFIYVGITMKNIRFTSTEGWKVKDDTRSTSSHVHLENGQSLKMKSKKTILGLNIVLDGKLAAYHKDGTFYKIITVKHNKIT